MSATLHTNLVYSYDTRGIYYNYLWFSLPQKYSFTCPAGANDGTRVQRMSWSYTFLSHINDTKSNICSFSLKSSPYRRHALRKARNFRQNFPLVLPSWLDSSGRALPTSEGLGKRFLDEVLLIISVGLLFVLAFFCCSKCVWWSVVVTVFPSVITGSYFGSATSKGLLQADIGGAWGLDLWGDLCFTG